MALDTKIYKMLKTQVEAEKAKALLTLELLNTKGLDGNTTEDFIKMLKMH